MKKAGHPLRLVAQAMQGHPPKEADWPTLLEISSRGWVVPALYVALARANQLDEMPVPVREYLSLLHDRNWERNRRLRAQLHEAISLLNAAAIEPVLLKGAIHLFTASDNELGSRMICDLDLGIAPGQMARSTAALMEVGYQSTVEHELERPDDAAVIELHDRPNARSAQHLAGDPCAWSGRTERDGMAVRIPSATARALHFIVHDMIKHGDYWSFRVDLRHLLDLASLAGADDGLDWKQLGTLLPHGAARQALVVQARALADLFGVPIPPDLRPSWQAELRHVARLVCASSGKSSSVVRSIGNLSLGFHRISDDEQWLGWPKFTQQVLNRLAGCRAGPRL